MSSPLEDEEELPFEMVSDTELSRSDRLARMYEEYVYIPVRVILEDWRSLVGLSILLGYVVVGVVGPIVLEPPEPNQAPLLLGPFENPSYPLGTDSIGQNLLKVLVHATPAMLKMIFAGAVFSTVMATLVGTLSGYKSGDPTDRILMTLTDIMMTIPGLPLIIVISAVFPPKSPYVVGLLLTINAWAGLARSIRSQVLSVREEAYVEASRLMGFKTRSIIRNDILPNIMPYVVINLANSARRVIFASVGLYFLGILPFTTLNWGVVLNLAHKNGAMYTKSTLYWILEPTIAIVMLSLAFILIAQGMDRLFNPRVRARNAKTTPDEGTSDGSVRGDQ